MDVVTVAAAFVGIDLLEAVDNTEWRGLLSIALHRGAATWERDLIRAIKARTLPATRVAIKDLDTRKPRYIDPRTVDASDLLDSAHCEITRDALVQWCKESGAPIPSALIDSDDEPEQRATYPNELRTAVEAFEAVHDAPLRGRTAKGVLSEWLKKHKPELSAHARERIATVANWQREGGAPKTLGK